MSNFSKICIRCNTLKNFTSFKMNKKSRSKVCRECKVKISTRARKRQRELYFLRPITEIRNSTLKKLKFKDKDYFLLLSGQNEVCAICKQPEKSKARSSNKFPRRLAVDHCHKTNKLRGLLCTKCNFCLGMVNDDIDILKSAVEYLIKYK